ncbi:unnamed protein product, partial [Amoebophrya sp. A25]|eukprot:GSA25T00001365001.1
MRQTYWDAQLAKAERTWPPTGAGVENGAYAYRYNPYAFTGHAGGGGGGTGTAALARHGLPVEFTFQSPPKSRPGLDSLDHDGKEVDNRTMDVATFLDLSGGKAKMTNKGGGLSQTLSTGPLSRKAQWSGTLETEGGSSRGKGVYNLGSSGTSSSSTRPRAQSVPARPSPSFTQDGDRFALRSLSPIESGGGNGSALGQLLRSSSSTKPRGLNSPEGDTSSFRLNFNPPGRYTTSTADFLLSLPGKPEASQSGTWNSTSQSRSISGLGLAESKNGAALSAACSAVQSSAELNAFKSCSRSRLIGTTSPKRNEAAVRSAAGPAGILSVSKSSLGSSSAALVADSVGVTSVTDLRAGGGTKVDLRAGGRHAALGQVVGGAGPLQGGPGLFTGTKHVVATTVGSTVTVDDRRPKYSTMSKASKYSKYMFDTSKIPEIYDNIYYDLTHRRDELASIRCIEVAEKIFNLVLPLNCWVTGAEFGISIDEKKQIGAEVCWRLADKVVGDLEFMLEHRDEAGKKMHLAGKKMSAVETSERGTNSMKLKTTGGETNTAAVSGGSETTPNLSGGETNKACLSGAENQDDESRPGSPLSRSSSLVIDGGDTATKTSANAGSGTAGSATDFLSHQQHQHQHSSTSTDVCGASAPEVESSSSTTEQSRGGAVPSSTPFPISTTEQSRGGAVPSSTPFPIQGDGGSEGQLSREETSSTEHPKLVDRARSSPTRTHSPTRGGMDDGVSLTEKTTSRGPGASSPESGGLVITQYTATSSAQLKHQVSDDAVSSMGGSPLDSPEASAPSARAPSFDGGPTTPSSAVEIPHQTS